jgi:phosphatidylserine/phosphatidylglycerophosphate/cardiolipin synthase-like enzyme
MHSESRRVSITSVDVYFAGRRRIQIVDVLIRPQSDFPPFFTELLGGRAPLIRRTGCPWCADDQGASNMDLSDHVPVRRVDVRLTATWSMHEKLIIVDGEVVVFGSYNFSERNETNDENILIIHNRTIAAVRALNASTLPHPSAPASHPDVSQPTGEPACACRAGCPIT